MVFLLDDSHADLEIIEHHLRKNGISDIKSFTKYEPFLNELTRNVIAVLIDHDISSDLNGLDVMKKVVNKNPMCYPIIVSGNDSINVILDYVDNGCFRYVVKSDPKYLEKIVENVRQAEIMSENILQYVSKWIMSQKK